jgi:hypothetical protein
MRRIGPRLPHCAWWRRYVLFLIAIALASNLLAAETRLRGATESLHRNLLNGQPVAFDKANENSQRGVPAAWIREATTKPVKIEIRNALITGPLDLTHSTIERPIFFIGCTFEQRPDFSESIFKEHIIFSNCVFEQGVFFRNATVQTDIILRRSEVRNGIASFVDANFQGSFDGSGLRFFPNVRANFKRATFGRTALFNGAVFEDEACFRNAHFSADAQFQNVVFKQKADYSAVHADGAVSFRAEDTEGEGRIPAASFEGQADFSGAEFLKSIEFQGVQFQDSLDFNSTEVLGDAFFEADSDHQIAGPTFQKEVDFTNAHFGKAAYFSGAVFKDRANFNTARIDGYASFWGKPQPRLLSADQEAAYFRGARFEGDADFSHAQIGAEAQFEGAIFVQKATFYDAQIGGAALFDASVQQQTKGTIFHGDVNFDKVRFRGDVRFQGSVFESLATFDRADIAGMAWFRSEPESKIPGTSFGKDATFTLLHVAGQAEFQGAKFSAGADFGGARFDGNAFFFGQKTPEILTVFDGTVSFTSAHIIGAAQFQGASFNGDAQFYATQFDGPARFYGQGEKTPDNLPTVFRGTADFRLVHFSADVDFSDVSFHAAWFDGCRGDALVNFQNAAFRDVLTLQEATVRVLHFSVNGRLGENAQAEGQFQSTVDMRNCTYDRLYEGVDRNTNWRALTNHFDLTGHFDRQPFVQLQKVFRSVGQDALADEVYIYQQDKERELKCTQRDYEACVLDWLYWGFLNYGVRPYRLWMFSLILIFFGTWLFSLQDAVELQQPSVSSESTGQGVDQTPKPIKASKWEALGVSTRYFLPIPVIVGSRLVPSSRKKFGRTFRFWILSLPLTITPAGYAFFLQVAGWLLVPFAIAAFSGLLRVS